MANSTSQHILSTSVNLLGFCLIVITSVHLTNYTESSFIDETTSVVAMLLGFSCLFSFFSLRSKNPARSQKLELIADYLFIISLVGILLVILLLVLHFIK